jgi:hypothetical protein
VIFAERDRKLQEAREQRRRKPPGRDRREEAGEHIIAMSSRRRHYDPRPSQKTLSRIACNRFSGARWYVDALQNFQHPSWSRSVDLMNDFDSTVREGYTDGRPVKQRLATLRSDPLRDTRHEAATDIPSGEVVVLPHLFMIRISRAASSASKTSGI